MERMWLLRGASLLTLSVVLADARPLAAQNTVAPSATLQMATSQTAAPRMSAEAALHHFEKKVRPILVSHCYECHSADAMEIRGGLALDTREGNRLGTDLPSTIEGVASG